LNKYKKLAQDLTQARVLGAEAGKGDDGGSANQDAAFLKLPRWNESMVLNAIAEAGLYCTHKTKWIGYGYLINPVGCGQGNSNARGMEAIKKHLKECGYDVLGFYKMD